MKKEDLKKLTHLSINEEVQGKFYHIHAEDGFIITSWKDDDNIEDYHGSKCLYMPLADEYPDLRIITDAEHIELASKAKEARKERLEAEREARKEERKAKLEEMKARRATNDVSEEAEEVKEVESEGDLDGECDNEENEESKESNS